MQAVNHATSTTSSTSTTDSSSNPKSYLENRFQECVETLQRYTHELKNWDRTKKAKISFQDVITKIGNALLDSKKIQNELNEEMVELKYQEQLNKALIDAHLGNGTISFGTFSRLTESQEFLDSTPEAIKSCAEKGKAEKESDLVKQIAGLAIKATKLREDILAKGLALSQLEDVGFPEDRKTAIAHSLFLSFKQKNQEMIEKYNSLSLTIDQKLNGMNQIDANNGIKREVTQLSRYRNAARLKLVVPDISISHLLMKFNTHFSLNDSITPCAPSIISSDVPCAAKLHEDVVGFKEGLRLVKIWSPSAPEKEQNALYNIAINKLEGFNQRYQAETEKLSARKSPLATLTGKQNTLSDVVQKTVEKVREVETLLKKKSSNLFGEYLPNNEVIILIENAENQTHAREEEWLTLVGGLRTSTT